jgi:hypothetical protein
VIGIPTTIRVVTMSRDVALVIEQPVENMQGFTCRRGNHLGVERGIAVREVGVELASWLIAVMGLRRAASRPNPPARKNWPSEEDATPLPKIAASGSRCC